MSKQTNSQNIKIKDRYSIQTATIESLPHNQISQIPAYDETLKEYDKNRFEDTVEMFRNLITGDDHYHSRSSVFVQLFG